MPQDLTGDGPHRAVPANRQAATTRQIATQGARRFVAGLLVDRRPCLHAPPPRLRPPVFRCRLRPALAPRGPTPPSSSATSSSAGRCESHPTARPPVYRSVETRGGPERAPQRAQLPPLRHACGTLCLCRPLAVGLAAHGSGCAGSCQCTVEARFDVGLENGGGAGGGGDFENGTCRTNTKQLQEGKTPCVGISNAAKMTF